MCGISGICSFEESKIGEAVIKGMTDELRHRGPDDEGYFFDSRNRVALGHRRLSIIDLNTGHQPIFNEDGSIAIVFNGEIYNFLELREGLKKKGHNFKTNTDTEVIVHLYEDSGIECLRKLRGMFAFAIWDSRKEELLLARDRIGKKPLYYAIVNKKIFFASEIQALYKVPEIKRDIDYSAIDLYISYSCIPSPYTIYKDIKNLPPAHFLCFNKDSATTDRYWRPDYNKKTRLDYEEAKNELTRLLSESVRLRLISDVPLGAFLSGGTDSSAIVALMSRFSDYPVKTFSIGFSNAKYNELPYARQIAQRYNTEHHEFVVEPNAIEVLSEIVKHYGEPYGDSSALPTWYLSKMTKQHVTVALNGDGGDELFAGYPWYYTIHLFNTVSRFTSPYLFRHVYNMGYKMFPRRIKKALELLSKSEKERFQMLRSYINSDERNALFHDYFKDKLNSNAVDYLTGLYDESLNEDYDRSFNADILSYLPEDLLVKVDRASMAHGLECRSPLLDQELIDFSCTLPPFWKIKNGETKVILRDVISNLFPEGFLKRPKMGFSVPIGEWFRGELKAFTCEKLINGPLTSIPLFKGEQLKVILEEHFAGKRNFETLIWNLLMLSLWFEEYGSA